MNISVDGVKTLRYESAWQGQGPEGRQKISGVRGTVGKQWQDGVRSFGYHTLNICFTPKIKTVSL